jgi:hypothetical protein
MALDTKLILEVLNEHFAAWEVRFDNFLKSGSKVSTVPASSSSPSKQGAAQEASKAVIAENWGGLFDGGDDLDATVSNTASAESVGLHDVPIPIQSAVFGAGVFADNWGGLFDGGDDLDATVSNTASAESVGLHDVPVWDPASFNLDAAHVVLALDATTAILPIQIQEGGISQHKRTDPISERANEFEGGLTTLRRAPPSHHVLNVQGEILGVRLVLDIRGKFLCACRDFDDCGEFHGVRLVLDDRGELVCV